MKFYFCPATKLLKGLLKFLTAAEIPCLFFEGCAMMRNQELEEMRVLLIILAALTAAACQSEKNKDIARDGANEYSLDRPQQAAANFVSVDDILARYGGRALGRLEQFDGIVFNGGLQETEAVLRQKGFTHDDRTPELEQSADSRVMRFWIGTYAGIGIEPAFAYRDGQLKEIVFSIEPEDKRRFMEALAELYGKPVYNEKTSNTYLWNFTDGYIAYAERPAYGLVTLALF
jgi:hypothetical protein